MGPKRSPLFILEIVLLLAIIMGFLLSEYHESGEAVLGVELFASHAGRDNVVQQVELQQALRTHFLDLPDGVQAKLSFRHDLDHNGHLSEIEFTRCMHVARGLNRMYKFNYLLGELVTGYLGLSMWLRHIFWAPFAIFIIWPAILIHDKLQPSRKGTLLKETEDGVWDCRFDDDRPGEPKILDKIKLDQIRFSDPRPKKLKKGDKFDGIYAAGSTIDSSVLLFWVVTYALFFATSWSIVGYYFSLLPLGLEPVFLALFLVIGYACVHA